MSWSIKTWRAVWTGPTDLRMADVSTRNRSDWMRMKTLMGPVPLVG